MHFIQHQREAMARLAAAIALTMASSAFAAPACDIASFKLPADTTLVSARSFATPVNYCRLDGYITTTNPGPNRVNFMLALPEHHNGRYVFTIQGGAAAFVPDPTDAHLQDGYAIASTDKGVRAAHGLDFTFRNDPVQALDWAYRGVHVTAVATQELTRQYYQTKHFYRYAMGCSGGGDGTLAAAENTPADFDGYVGAAMSTSPLEPSMVWGRIAQHLAKNPGGWIAPEQLTAIEKVIMQKFDDSDGAIDGLIWDPTRIKLARSDLPFLNDAQFRSLELLQEGTPGDSEVWYPGYWLSNPSGFSSFAFGTKPPPWTIDDRPPAVPAGWLVADSASKAAHGPQFSYLTDFDFSDIKQLRGERELGMTRVRPEFNPAHLRNMEKQGAKLILWTGSSDQAVPPNNILNYTTTADRIYGPDKRKTFIRTYFVPGMFHCSGGVNQPTDVPLAMLDKMVQWVEKGIAPEAVIATRGAAKTDIIQTFNATPGSKPHALPQADNRSYLLCPWPQRTVFKGGLDNPNKLAVTDAGNWSCRDD